VTPTLKAVPKLMLPWQRNTLGTISLKNGDALKSTSRPNSHHTTIFSYLIIMWKIKGFQRPHFPLPPSFLHSPQNVIHSILISCNKFSQKEIKIRTRKMFTYHCCLQNILVIFCCTCICNNLTYFSCLYVLLQPTRLGFPIFCHFCFQT